LQKAWSDPIVQKLNEEFKGATRIILSAQGYYIDENDPIYDVGFYIETLDAMRFFTIASYRGQSVENPNLYAGLDVTLLNRVRNKLTLGSWLNLGAANKETPGPDSHGGAVALTWNFKLEGMPGGLSVGGFSNSYNFPQYTHPTLLGQQSEVSRTLQHGGFVTFTLGSGGTQPPTFSQPGMLRGPGQRQY